jgi:hypothetical protein
VEDEDCRSDDGFGGGVAGCSISILQVVVPGQYLGRLGLGGGFVWKAKADCCCCCWICLSQLRIERNNCWCLFLGKMNSGGGEFV